MFKNYILSGDITPKPWNERSAPKRVLVIRLQALGDMIITLPYTQCLRNTLPPATKIDLLTGKEVDAIPRNIYLYNRVYSIKGGWNFKKQFLYTCAMLPMLLFRRYDVIIDLQDNLLSRMVIKFTRPKAWSIFDRHSPIPAGERTRITIENAGLGANFASSNFKLRPDFGIDNLLLNNGWDGSSALVILNPAGAFETRNWPVANYVSFAKLWMGIYPKTQFLVIGVDAIASEAAYFKKELSGSVINLVNKTTPVQAFAIMQKAEMVLSEDSGLMHMAWVSGKPTLALFGSTRSDWARPLGKHTAFLDSSDLPCGNCMQETCKYGDNHCLTRYTPEMIFMKAVELLQSLSVNK